MLLTAPLAPESLLPPRLGGQQEAVLYWLTPARSIPLLAMQEKSHGISPGTRDSLVHVAARSLSRDVVSLLSSSRTDIDSFTLYVLPESVMAS